LRKKPKEPRLAPAEEHEGSQASVPPRKGTGPQDILRLGLTEVWTWQLAQQ